MPDLDDGLTYPLNSDAANQIGSYIEVLARDVRAKYVQDLLSNQPAFGKPGRIFHATDTGEVFVDRGTSWLQLSNGSQGLASSRPASMPRNGMTYYATDTGDLSTWYNGAYRVTSTARAEAAAGAVITSTGNLPIGVLTATVPDVFARDGALTEITVAFAGLYRVHWMVDGDYANVVAVAPNPTPIDGGSPDFNGIVARTTTRRLGAAQGFKWSASMSGGSANLVSMTIERVGP